MESKTSSNYILGKKMQQNTKENYFIKIHVFKNHFQTFTTLNKKKKLESHQTTFLG